MSIIKENVILTKNALFYKKNQDIETNRIIEELIELATSNKNEKDFLLNEINESSILENLEYKYSIRIFQVNKPVHFIKEKELFDQIFAYILIIEIGDYIIVFSRNSFSILKELKEKFQLIKNIDFAKTLRKETEYQKLTLRNMTISEQDIRSRSFEAKDLNGVLSLHSAGRSIPSYIKVKDAERKMSLSSTGRLVEDSERINIDDLALWASFQINLLESNNEKDSFLDNFAKHVDFKEVVDKYEPTAILLEYHAIHDQIEVNGTPIFKKLKNGQYSKICDKRRSIIFQELEKIHEITGIDSNSNGILGAGKLRKNQNRYSIQSLQLKKYYIDENGTKITLQNFINKNHLFSVTFTDPSYMYFMGNIYQNTSSRSEIKNILDALDTSLMMDNVTSEKGTILTDSNNFSKDSLFYAIENHHSKDDYIFCDDLGDEWADHITINNKNNCISFIHSKYKEKSSTSASNLHDITGQAIKNLGNMYFSKEKFLEKKLRLNAYYSQSDIHKVRKGDLDDLGTDLENLLKQHSLHRKCIIACPFLSRQDMENEFNNLAAGNKVRGHIIQLLWILSSFIHAAKELGIIPIIYCKL